MYIKNTMMRSLGYLEWLKSSFWKYKISKNRYQIGTAAILPKYGIVKALHLTIDIDYHLFDTFPTK